MSVYQHTQPGTLMRVIFGAACLMLAAAGVTVSPYALLGVPLMLLLLLMFHSLTIEITQYALRWRFGIGLIQKEVPLPEIASVRSVRTNFLEGWGIHWSRYGWLYNVSGCDAVAITLTRGKRFALGTDEPQKLASELNHLLKQHSRFPETERL